MQPTRSRELPRLERRSGLKPSSRSRRLISRSLEPSPRSRTSEGQRAPRRTSSRRPLISSISSAQTCPAIRGYRARCAVTSPRPCSGTSVVGGHRLRPQRGRHHRRRPPTEMAEGQFSVRMELSRSRHRMPLPMSLLKLRPTRRRRQDYSRPSQERWCRSPL